METATTLLQQHLKWLVNDNGQWQKLIADDVVWDLPYGPSLGHPLTLEGREAVLRHANWFVAAVKDFQFFDEEITAMADAQHAVARVKGEGLAVSTGRTYRQEYVVFLTARDGRIVHLREYFDPVQAARAFDAPIAAMATGSL